MRRSDTDFVKVRDGWAHLHWERPSRDANHRATVEVGGELVAVHRGAHEDELQVRPPHDDVLQDGQQKVRLDAALVDLMEVEIGAGLEKERLSLV